MERVVETEVCGYVLVFDELTGFIGVALLQRPFVCCFHCSAGHLQSILYI